MNDSRTESSCGVIHRMCSHIDIKRGLPKGHDGAHRTLIQFLGGRK